ncbi:MAG: ROK family protein [Ruminococcaceae bacterium]|nr:ROK family protein [Oscillospiraceae bacterium]
MSYRLGIDVGGTKICVGLVQVTDHVSLVAHKRLAVSKITDVVIDIRTAVDALCDEKGVNINEIEFCGVGIPGTVSADGRRILKAPNISVLSENFADLLSAALHGPVRMLQDSRAAAWGEYRCGRGQGANTLICMTLGTGIGTGLVIGGRLYHGALGTAGELGHVPVVENGRPCGCGKRGCVEKYAAGGGLDLTAQELLGEGKDAKDLFLAAKVGNSQAQLAIDSAIEQLGRVLVGAVNLLSPDAVLFSGGLSCEESFLSALIAYIKAHCYAASHYPVLARAALGELAPLIGAAMAKEA